MYKKSQLAFQAIMFIVRLAYLTAVVITVIALTMNQINQSVNTSLTENYVLYYALAYSEDLMLTDNVIDRIYPNTIDLDKLKNPQVSKKLDKSIYYGIENDHIAAKITFKDEKKQQTIIFYNAADQKGYQEWEVLVGTGIGGPGSATERIFSNPTLYNDAKIKLGTIEISIIKPNS